MFKKIPKYICFIILLMVSSTLVACQNDKIEIITPSECFETTIEKIYNITLDEEKEVGNTNDEIWVKLSNEPKNYRYAIARTIGIKNVR